MEKEEYIKKRRGRRQDKIIIQKREKNFILYSVPVLKNNKLNEVKKFIDIVSKTKKEATVIFMFHSILKEGSMYYEDLFSWDYKDFYDLCLFLNKMRNEKKINIIKTIDIFSKD